VVGGTLGLQAPYLLGGGVIALEALAWLPVINDRAVQAARDAASPAGMEESSAAAKSRGSSGPADDTIG
jgi:hypothetical protein